MSTVHARSLLLLVLLMVVLFAACSFSVNYVVINHPSVADRFRIEEISITGSHGAIRLEGDQARKSFVFETRSLCSLTYR